MAKTAFYLQIGVSYLHEDGQHFAKILANDHFQIEVRRLTPVTSIPVIKAEGLQNALIALELDEDVILLQKSKISVQLRCLSSSQRTAPCDTWSRSRGAHSSYMHVSEDSWHVVFPSIRNTARHSSQRC
jgi:hypothetical protein